MKTTTTLTFSDVSKSIHNRRLFHALEVTVNPGECIVLSGDNGVGKTTLLRILSGLLKPDTGQCRYNSTAHAWRQARAWLLRNVVYLHQKPYLFDASVTDNVAYGLRRHGHRISQARAMALDALQRAGLAHLAMRNATHLSGGEAQRVALLRAWVVTPCLLLLDEPVANMDEQAKHRTLFLIRQLLQDGASLIITAHEPRLFASLGGRHLCLANGGLTDAAPLHTAGAASSPAKPHQPGDVHEQWQRH